MRFKRKSTLGLVMTFLVGVMVVASCSPGPVGIETEISEPTDQNGTAVSSPEMARDRALDYLRRVDVSVPAAQVAWQGKDISSGETIGTENFLYTYENWTVSIISPQVEPENKVFTVVVLNQPSGFQWAGLVDAKGEIVPMGSVQPTPAVPTVTFPTMTATNVPIPTATLGFYTPTPIPVPCNDASFLEDVTIPDGTTFSPGQAFLKEWRLRNVGSCTWDRGYDLVFVGGNRMGAQRAIPLAETVRPGETADLGAYMYAPLAPGDYRGFWMLRNPQGIRFGVGDDADDSFWVEISVVGDFDSGDHRFDFALDFCAAVWRTADGPIACGNEFSPENGLVQFLISPEFENRHENEPTIWVHPNEDRDGWIEGTYPSVTIEDGDHFMSWVGCLGGYELCNVTFYLSYIGEDGRTRTLGTWREVYDGEVSMLDIDLSSLEGESVQFILGMEAGSPNVSSAQGFWFVPRIE